MTIRRARDGDVGAVTSLLSEVLEIHAAIRPDVFISGTTKYTPDELRSIFADGQTPVYVAEDGGEVLGYAFCRITDRPASNHIRAARTMYVDDLCVDAFHRKKGVGEALFRHVCAESKRLGCSEVTLTVWEGNDAARRFYEKMGMSPLSTKMSLEL